MLLVFCKHLLSQKVFCDQKGLGIAALWRPVEVWRAFLSDYTLKQPKLAQMDKVLY
jgi:hypothetical protein